MQPAAAPRHRRLLALLLGTTCFGGTPALAQTWNGTISTDWFVANNWTPGTVPTAAGSVIINTNATPNAPTIGSAGAVASNVTLGSAALNTGILKIDGGSLTANTNDVFLVGDFGTGKLTISNGGSLASGITAVGNNAGSNGTVTVTGTNSQWTVNFPFFQVGSSGTGTLNVESGGKVTSAFTLELGGDNGAVGHVNLSGSGSQITVGGTTVGAVAGSSGDITVTGPGATFAGGLMNVGGAAQGTLKAEAGGIVTASQLTVGTSAVGKVTLTGTDTKLTVTNALRVGQSKDGDGTLSIEAAATASSGSGQIGTNTGAAGTVTVTGAGSQWKITNSLAIGQSAASGTGKLNVLDGGRVDALAFTGFNSAVVKVDGKDSQLNLPGSGMTLTTLTLGATGAANKLDLTGGATLTSRGAVFNTVAGSGVAVTVDGDGTTWNPTGITLGGAGTATMGVANKAKLGVTGDLIVDGAATTALTISSGATVTQDPGVPGTGQFRLGVDAHGTLTVKSGGALETLGHPTFATFTFLARNQGSSATATITDAGSIWKSHGIFIVGQDGNATLDILNGGTLTGERGATIAASPTSVSSVTVSGKDSLWSISEPPPLAGVGNISIGRGGDGTLKVLDGARVAAQGVGVGSSFTDFLNGSKQTPGIGLLTVSGAGSKLDLNVAAFQTFDVAGNGGKGTANILDGGQVTVVGSGSIGSSTIVAGIQLLGDGTVTVDGANSRLTMTQTFDIGAHATGALNVQNGAFVSNSDGYLGSYTNINGGAGSGTATVTGSGSKWENTGFLRVGDQGDGVLKVLSGGTVTSTDGVIANETGTTGTATIGGTGSNWTLSGGIAIGNLGTGTLTLTDGGALSASGASWIGKLGTLNIGSGGKAGTFGAPSLANAGQIHFDHTDTTTLAVAVSGAGTVVKDGIGTAILTGANTYTGLTTINAGILQIGNGGAAGSLTGDVLDDALLAVNRTGSFTYGGAISGSGGFRQFGTGTTILTGANTYAGDTNIDAGTLAVNGSILGPVFVNNGGTLSGTGTVGPTTVRSGGTFAPGNSIGTTNVSGNTSFAAASTYAVEINAAGQNDKIVATGTGALAGGTVQVLAETGSYGLETVYTILTAQNGVSGTFADVTSNLAFLTPSLTYDPNNVFLTMLRNTTEFGSVGNTRNQRAVGRALDDSPFGSALVQAVIDLSPDAARQAFDALSGEIHAGIQSTLVDDSRYFRGAMLDRLRALSEMPSNQTASRATRPLLADAAGSPLLARDAADGMSAAPGREFTAWVQAIGAFGDFAGDGNAARASRRLGGFLAGLDGQWSGWRLGIATGYSQSTLEVDSRRSTGTVDTAYLGAYGAREFGPWSLRAGGAYAWHTIDTRRTVAFPDFSEIATARYDGGTGQLFGEIGYGASFRNVALEPFAGLAWVAADTGSFGESGGAAALDGRANSMSIGYWTLGVRAATKHVFPNDMTVLPRASLAWQHTLGGTTPDARLAFETTGIAFSVGGVPLARDTALLEAGLDVPLTAQATLGLVYGGQYGGGLDDHAIQGKFFWRF